MSPEAFVPDDQKETEIARYLIQVPDFFKRHQDLLMQMAIPHQSGDAVSLVEHQVRLLRQQNTQYQTQLNALIEVAKANDETAKRLHQLTLLLIETRDLDELFNTLLDGLRELLHMDAVELKLFSADELETDADESGPAMFRHFLYQGPVCGPLPDAQMDYLFGSQVADIQSVALMPLRSSALIGMLALGSRHVERFMDGKGVDFLQRLAEIVSAALNTVQKP